MFDETCVLPQDLQQSGFKLILEGSSWVLYWRGHQFDRFSIKELDREYVLHEACKRLLDLQKAVLGKH